MGENGVAQQFVVLSRISTNFSSPSPPKLSAITCENPQKAKRKYNQ